MRVWGVDYGLPQSYHPDEGRIVTRAVRFHGGDLDPHFFNWPSLYMYVLSALYGLVFGFPGVLEAFSRDATPFYILGRVLTAAMGVATVAVLYALAAETYGATIGLVASLFLTVSLLHVRDSHYITTDVPLTFLVTVTVLFILRYWREGRARDAVLSGLFTGLAASMKYPGGLALLPFVLAHFSRPRPGGAGRLRHAISAPVLAGAAATGGFLIGTPYALVTPVAFWRGVASELGEVHSVQFGNEADLPGYLFHLVHSFPEGMGVPLFVLALGGLGLALYGRRAEGRILLAFAIPYFVVIGAWSSRFERYTLPLLPFMALLAASCLVAVVGWIGQTRWKPVVSWPRGLGLVLATGLVVAPELVRVAQYHVLLSRPDTRVVAGLWIEQAIPSGARITMEPYSPAIPLAPAMVRTQRAHPDQSVDATIARQQLHRYLASPVGQVEQGYWISRLNRYDLDRLLAEKVEYVVLSGFVYERHQRACGRYPDACRFYQELERRGTLLFAIDPGIQGQPLWVGDIYSPLTRLSERTRPGPSIKIYRLPSPNGAP